MIRRSRTLACALGVSLLVSALACKKPVKAGAPCEGLMPVCTDAHTELACIDGKYVSMRCMGVGGCASGNDGTTCDILGNTASEPCSDTQNDAPRCTPDHKARVRCTNGKTEVVACDGLAGCKDAAEFSRLECDKAYHEAVYHPGDSCSSSNNDDACSDDHHAWVSCVKGKWTIQSLCRGAAGCKFHPELGAVACDTTVGEAGDACGGNDTTCSMDHKAVLTCQDGHFAKTSDCPGPKGCTTGKGQPSCDSGDAKHAAR